ncbi:DUF4386 domain-containing protein [Aquimarina pacifica]|uniref:DUF4386 domain-containing protein n=1 Tax=Aquimarina pacifica TaxID=1296415 RepID=UPI00046EF0D0|nr:DUF4386 domain-containing protein [Aquimarina pacifica]
MNRKQTSVRIAGLLFLIQIITYIIGNQVFVSPVLYTPNFFEAIYQTADKLLIGAILEIVCGIAVVAISVLLYPTLRRYSERIAIWYVGFRISEFTIIIFSKIKMLSLIPLSKEYMNTEGVPNEYLTILGTSILSEHTIAVCMVMIIFCIGATMFYYLLYRSKLIPRGISIWGLVGVLLVLIANIAQLSGIGLGMLIFVPMGLNELFLGFWLLLKGFHINTKKR